MKAFLSSPVLISLAYFISVAQGHLYKSRLQREASSRNTSKPSSIHCLRCISDNVPQVTMEIMKQAVNIKDDYKSASCSDPKSSRHEDNSEIMSTPCDSACIKVVSENKYMKIVIRGCLDQLYDPASFDNFLGPPRSPSASISDKDSSEPFAYVDICDQQRQTSSGIGEIVTDTCVCIQDMCNGSIGHKSLPIFLAIAVILKMSLSAKMFPQNL